MEKKSMKNMILAVIFIILAPVILLGMTYVGNAVSSKGKVQQTEQAAEKQVAKVPTENKTTQQNEIPKSEEQKVTSSENSNSDEKKTSETESSQTDKAIVGQEYTVKSGDSLFSIATGAYGEINSQKGIQKIREANNMQNDNLSIGQKIQIPKL